jgi:hypothetical protein
MIDIDQASDDSLRPVQIHRLPVIPGWDAPLTEAGLLVPVPHRKEYSEAAPHTYAEQEEAQHKAGYLQEIRKSSDIGVQPLRE